MLSILVWPSKSCTARKLPVAPIDQRCLCPPKRMGAKELGIESNAGNPFGDEPRILARRHALPNTASPIEQKFAALFARGFQIVVDGLAGLIRHFELDWATRLLLPYCRTVNCVPVRRNVVDFEGHNVATPKLAIDGQIEHGQVTGSSLDQQSGAD